MNAANVKTGLHRIAMLLTCLLAEGCLLNLNTPRAGRTQILDLGEGVIMPFVWCPPSEFIMGGKPEGPSLYWCEPCYFCNYKGEYFEGEHDVRFHRIRITKGFWIGKYEVTLAQWEKFIDISNYARIHGKIQVEDEPVEGIRWADAVKYCAIISGLFTKGEVSWLGKGPQAHGRFRLPTEAEWEYACRAGTRGPYNFRGEISLKKANYNANCFPPPPGHAVKVGSYPPNAWGLYDMHGNVREWVQDWYGHFPSGTATNPTGPVIEGVDPDNLVEIDKGWKVTRGGGCYDGESTCTSFARHKKGNMEGMRVVFEPADAP
jgi:formylglycine-generating enzyme required for sulfatase activity